MSALSRDKVRHLTLADLEIPINAPKTTPADEEPTVVDLGFERLDEDDVILRKVRDAIALGFAGVILSGPPGTGKSYYAKRVAGTIAAEPSAIRVVQFHASYQYEDFMVGFAPTGSGGFAPEEKVFPTICSEADGSSGLHVLLIDEFSRCDVARVFGEALTYLEKDKRGQSFTLASGRELTVPPNLVLLCTMNPWDKGVDEVDVALERRFAQIDLLPDPDVLRDLLMAKGAEADFVDRLVVFFRTVLAMEDEMLHVGHSYFLGCVDEDSARKIWEFRLEPFFRKACRLDKATLDRIVREWRRVAPPVRPGRAAGVAASVDGDGGEAPAEDPSVYEDIVPPRGLPDSAA